MPGVPKPWTGRVEGLCDVRPWPSGSHRTHDGEAAEFGEGFDEQEVVRRAR